ncbi:MAG: DNA-directed RNA polymerase subunit N [Candidatus Nanohaloarchaea archaeon]
MQFPVRCPSCGKVLSDKYEEFEERTDDDEDAGEVLDDLGVEKYCCRTVFLTHVESIDEVGKYQLV